MKRSLILPFAAALALLSVSGCQKHEEGAAHHELSTIVVTSPIVKDVVITQQYVCQIHSRRHIEICALESGYLQDIAVREGQTVKKGDVMFKIYPPYYEAELKSAVAEADLARIEFENTKQLNEKKVAGRSVVSPPMVAMAQAKLTKAEAAVNLARARLGFTDVKAPFDGIIDRLHEQLGSLVEEGDMLTTLSDNSVMWVYFNVPEASYLEYMAEWEKDQGAVQAADDGRGHAHFDSGDKAAQDSQGDRKDVNPDYQVAVMKTSSEKDQKIELVLADGSTFPQVGEIGAIEAMFNNETGNIPFRADFANPQGLLRHGQTGNVLLHKTLHNAVVIPQRAVFETLDKQYVFVVDKDHVAHQREIVVEHELEDIFVLKSGLTSNDRFILEGVRQVVEGQKVEYEFQKPEKVIANQKQHAE